MNLVDQPVALFRGPWWEGYCLAFSGPDVYFHKWLRDAVVRYRPKISAIAWKNYKNGVRAGLRDYMARTAKQFAIDAPPPEPLPHGVVLSVRPRGERISILDGTSPGVVPFFMVGFNQVLASVSQGRGNSRTMPVFDRWYPEITEFISLRHPPEKSVDQAV